MSASLSFSPKTPHEVLPRGVDFAEWFAGSAPGDSVLTQSVTVAPAGLTISGVQLNPQNSAMVTFEVSGGASKTKYNITVKVTTDQGFVVERTVLQIVT